VHSAFERRSAIVLLLLSIVTLISWWIGGQHGGAALSRSAPAAISVMAVAAFKARVIAAEFMEARHAPRLLRRLIDAWLVLLLGTLLVVYSWS
jgi:hypothetical protein